MTAMDVAQTQHQPKVEAPLSKGNASPDCRYQDMDKVEGIVRGMRLLIETMPGVDHRLPQGVGLLVRSKRIPLLEIFAEIQKTRSVASRAMRWTTTIDQS